MYKNALKEDLKRVVQELDGIVESTDTIVKLKTKLRTVVHFESDPDFVKTLIQNCIDERVSQKTKREPWQWKRRKKREIVLNRRPELYRGKYRCVQPKINLLKRRSYAGETQCFPCGTPSGCRRDSPLVSMEIPLRTAYGQAGRCGMQPKAKTQSSRAGAANENRNCGNFELVKVKQKLLEIRAESRERKNARGARAGVTF
ncbi:hypothetical protein TNCV_1491111 [Trichonephila clavipes]|nr:hypothetical protein TNCV_1491111 [Trichonephila clavipes]